MEWLEKFLIKTIYNIFSEMSIDELKKVDWLNKESLELTSDQTIDLVLEQKQGDL